MYTSIFTVLLGIWGIWASFEIKIGNPVEGSKAIMFTASIMLAGILPWYFLSEFKFMADMGIGRLSLPCPPTYRS